MLHIQVCLIFFPADYAFKQSSKPVQYAEDKCHDLDKHGKKLAIQESHGVYAFHIGVGDIPVRRFYSGKLSHGNHN